MQCTIQPSGAVFQGQLPGVFFKKKMFLEIWQNSQETPAPEPLF